MTDPAPTRSASFQQLKRLARNAQLLALVMLLIGHGLWAIRGLQSTRATLTTSITLTLDHLTDPMAETLTRLEAHARDVAAVVEAAAAPAQQGVRERLALASALVTTPSFGDLVAADGTPLVLFGAGPTAQPQARDVKPLAGLGPPVERMSGLFAPFTVTLGDGRLVIVGHSIASLLHDWERTTLPATSTLLLLDKEGRVWLRHPSLETWGDTTEAAIATAMTATPAARGFERLPDNALTGGAGQFLAWQTIANGQFRIAILVPTRTVWQIWGTNSLPTLAASLGLGFAVLVGFSVIGRRSVTAIERLAYSEQRFRDYRDAADDEPWEADATGILVRPRLRLRDWLAPSTSANAIIDLNALLNTFAAAYHARVLDQQRPFRDVDLVLTGKAPDGRDRVIRISGAPLFDPAGNCTGYRGVARDITALRTAQREAEHARLETERLATVVRKSSHLVLLVDCGQRIEWVNDTFVEVTGLDRAQVLGTIAGKGPFQAADVTSEILAGRTALAQGGPVRLPAVRYLRPDGSEYWLKVEVLPLHDSSGRLTGFVGMHWDITKERQLQAEMAMLAEIARRTGNMVLVTDRERRILWANPSFERQSGYRLEEVLGQNPGTLLQGEGTDTSTIATMRDSLKAGGGFSNVDVLNYARDGRPYWVRIEVVPLPGADGQTERFLAIETDITDQRRREEELTSQRRLWEDAARLAHVGTWTVDLVTKTTRWSEEVFRIYGLAPTKMISLTDAIKYYAPEARPRVEAAVTAAIERGEPFDFEEALIGADGQRRIVHAIGHPEVRDGVCVRIYGVIQDVTRQRATEQRLSQVEKLNALGQLAGGLAHELNNLLQPILSLTELELFAAQGDAARAERLSLMYDSAMKAREIVRRTLDFARANPRGGLTDGRGTMRLYPAERTICGALTYAARLMPSSFAITSETTPLEGGVALDSTDISQVFLNLLSNAGDATEWKGAAHIRVWAAGEGNDRRVQITVQDTGPGFPPAQLSRLMEPFYTTKPIGQGTGLGLSVVFGLISRVGGEMTLDNGPEGGARITLSLPLITATLAGQELAPDPTTRSPVEVA
ncbi:MAG: PAS domain S-box protein [Alphaproteobacteria bacterium]|nr:PAS domain S-box protein [Alphaproteobacteria bacterium]